MTDDEIRALVVKARAIAAPVGPMHALWDVIFDAEALLDGRLTVCAREQIEEYLLRMKV